MTAFSFKSYAARERTNGERKQLVTVKHGHPLNNDHRAPFASGSTAARALLAQAQRQLSDPETGPNYFNQLRQIHDGATISGERVKKRLQERQARAATALSNSDIDLNGPKLVLAVEIAQVQARLAEKLLPEIQADGRATDSVIDEVDRLTRRALRAATSARTGEQIVEQPRDRVAGTTADLLTRLSRVPGNDAEASATVVGDLVASVRSGDADRIAGSQAALAALLAPEAAQMGRPEDASIGDAAGIARRLGRLVEADSVGAANEDQIDPNAWSNALLDRLARSPGIDHSDDADVVLRFSTLIYDLERELPLAIERDEPLWEIPDAIDPTDFARTRDSLSASMGADFNPQDGAQSETLDEQARSAVWRSMDMDEREFAATMIALDAGQRIEVGMQIVNSTPPLIQLPEAELGQGRFDVRMATEEEAAVMDSLIHWAGEQRSYPGAEKSFEQIDAMKSLSMPSGDLGAMTYGLAVANNPASISHATGIISKIPATDRVIIHTENKNVADQLIEARQSVLRAAGIDRPFQDGADATRAYGGWTLQGDADRVLGADPRDAQVFVAATDRALVYNDGAGLEFTSSTKARETLANAQSAQKTASEDLTRSLDKARAEASPALVARLEAIAESGNSVYYKLPEEGFKGADQKIALELSRRQMALRSAGQRTHAAQQTVEKIDNQSKQTAFRRAGLGDIARAEITEAAQRQGKLHQVFVPAAPGDRSVVQTKAGSLTEERPYVAARKAETLLEGDSYERRTLRDALSSGIGGRFNGRNALTATLVGGSNFFSEQKGAKAGIAALNDRIDALPKTGVILIDDNEKNPVVQQVLKRNPRLIHATAWRVTERSNPISDGRRITLSDRRTELDLGVSVPSNSPVGTPRRFSYQDLKNTTVMVHGGGQMSRETYDAIQEEAARRGVASHALDQRQAMAVHADLVKRGLTHLEAPRPAEPALARAIMQEALVDFADQAVLASDMGRDYHSANLIRQSIDADKLASLVDKTGAAVDLVTAREHAVQFAPSISDNTRRDLGNTLTAFASSDYGQLVLNALPGVDSQRAAKIGEAYQTLGDVMVAAENGEASTALPRSLHHEIGRPAAWASAVKRAENVAEHTTEARMDGLSATSADYPETMKAAGRTPMIFTMKDVDLNVPTVALIVGGRSRPLEADVEAAKTIAAEAHAKGMAVSLHLSGDASATIAKELASMPEETRPRILLIGDGHPTAHGNAKVLDAVISVAEAGGGYATVTAPLPTESATPDQIKEGTFSYAADRRTALDFQARQASAVVLVKSTGNDMEMIALKTAIGEGKPIAAVGPVQGSDPSVTDLRFRGADYSANRRLLEGGNSVSVMLETRHLAFQPNFIPDMTAQAENHYVPFEGSTAGQQNPTDRNRNQEDEVDRSAIESGGKITTTIDWSRAAISVQDGREMGAFLNSVLDGEVASIQATQEHIANRGLANDARFLDVASRSTTSADVRQVFDELTEQSRNSIDTDLQEQFLRQRSGAGR